VAEELQQLTVLDVCGYAAHLRGEPRKYVFRITPHATMDN